MLRWADGWICSRARQSAAAPARAWGSGDAAMLAAGKGGATKYPLRCRPINMPRSVKACSARVTVVRDSPNSAASVRLAGSAAPGAKKPCATACTSMSHNCRCNVPGGWAKP